MNVTTRIALHLIPDLLKTQPVFLCIDDTMVAKFGTKFENVSKLFDHATHNGSNYLNGHCFVSLMLCVPVWKHHKISYLAVPLGYRMWQKKESKLQLAASMVRQVMPEFSQKKNVIILVLCQEKVQVKHELFTSIICLMPHLFPFVLVLSNISFRSH